MLVSLPSLLPAVQLLPYIALSLQPFLNICELRLIGKNRRYALPACVIMKIRSLYPSIDGKYKAFKASEFVSRI